MPRKLKQLTKKECVVEGWSEAKYRGFITGVLRSGYRRFPNKYEVLKEAGVGKKLNLKTGRVGNHYKCAECNKEYPAKEVNVNHIEPVVPVTGFTTWDDLIARLFCDKSNLEVLCISCHAIITKGENEERRRNKKKVPEKEAV